MRARYRVLPLGLLALAACAGPRPEIPAAPLAPERWTSSEAPQAASDLPQAWWAVAGDPYLDALMSRVDTGADVSLARARLDEAQARLRSARAALRPNLQAAADREMQRIDTLEETQMRAALSASFMLDLNGALGARRAAAEAGLAAERAQLAAIRQATRATTVRLYVAWMEALERAAAEAMADMARVQRATLAASRQRAGLVSDIELAAIRGQAAAGRTGAFRAREAADQARLGIEALLGLRPGELDLPPAAHIPLLAGPDAALAPVAVLAQRPDLEALAQLLRAVGFEADASRRDFWPSLTLGAAIGAGEVEQGSFFSAEGLLTRATAGLLAPVFSAGRLEAARDASDARLRAAAIHYRQGVVQALSEVEQGLVARTASTQRLAALAQAHDEAKARAALVAMRQGAGLEPLAELLLAREAEARAAADHATARADRARAHVALMVAMGLGAR